MKSVAALRVTLSRWLARPMLPDSIKGPRSVGSTYLSIENVGIIFEPWLSRATFTSSPIRHPGFCPRKMFQCDLNEGGIRC